MLPGTRALGGRFRGHLLRWGFAQPGITWLSTQIIRVGQVVVPVVASLFWVLGAAAMVAVLVLVV
jgi:hypothetical protein